jgi:hypothetical protein
MSDLNDAVQATMDKVDEFASGDAVMSHDEAYQAGVGHGRDTPGDIQLELSDRERARLLKWLASPNGSRIMRSPYATVVIDAVARGGVLIRASKR